MDKLEERARPQPGVIPPKFIVSLRGEWDREVGSGLTVVKARCFLHELHSSLKSTIPQLEDELVQVLKKRDRVISAALENRLELCRARRQVVQELLQLLEREPAEFVDEFIVELENLTEERLNDTSILDLGRRTREKRFDMTRITCSKPHVRRTHSRVRCMCRHPTQPDQLYLGFEDGTVSVWDLQELRRLKHVNTGVYPITCILIAPVNGKTLLFTGSKDKTVRVWDTEKWQCTNIFMKHQGRVRAMQLVGNTLFSAGYDRKIMRWDLKTARHAGDYLETDSPIHAFIVARMPATTLFVTGHRNGEVLVHTSAPHKAGLHEFADKASVQKLEGHTQPVRCLLQHMEFLLCGSDDKVITQWDFRTFKKVRDYKRHVDSVVSLRTTADHVMFSASQDALVILWNLQDGSMLRELHHHYHFVTCLEVVTMPEIPAPQEAQETEEADAQPVSIETTTNTSADKSMVSVPEVPPLPPRNLSYLVTGSFDKTFAVMALLLEVPAAENDPSEENASIE
eukprot:TRINITY_DN3046_c0_g2_i1.p1 TRINITY_DN3046_c0_g2~~TRINITY_DN3046_c0_g2_i1.p1  ORF type:complete len:512 (-),score=87.71 TRINITY_DN3046_c0_g2_i1:2606-4141(-)